MAFWSESSSSPLRNYRFRVQGLLDKQWLVKSVTLPSFEVSQNSYRILNHQTKIAGILTWQDVTITTVADKDTVSKLQRLMSINGHALDTPTDRSSKGIVSSFKGKMSNKILIEMLDAQGATATSYTLVDWFIAGIKFGDLDYSNDELFTVEVVIAYEYADIN
tara:strand:- start:892 stop:1380 length:489 start_codon:yes stop_codon:yes gene_type:complete